MREGDGLLHGYLLFDLMREGWQAHAMGKCGHKIITTYSFGQCNFRFERPDHENELWAAHSSGVGLACA